MPGNQLSEPVPADVINFGLVSEQLPPDIAVASNSAMDRRIPELILRKRRQRQMLLALAAVLLAAGLAWLVFGGHAAVPSVPRRSLWIGQAQQGAFVQEIRASGNLVPSTARWLTASTAARVERIVTLPGSDVKADTVILQLSNPSVEDEWRNSETELAATKTDYDIAKMDLQSKLLDLEAANSLAIADRDQAILQEKAESRVVENGTISRVQFERSQIQRQQLQRRAEISTQRLAMFRDSMPQQLQASASRLEQRTARAALKKAEFDALTVRAGMDGVLNQLLVEEGMQLAAGVNLGRVARSDKLVAWVKIPQHMSSQLKLGQSATIELSGGKLPARLERIFPAIRDGMVTVELQPQGTLPEGLRFDQIVDARVEIGRIDSALSLPRPDGAEPNRELSLFRIEVASDLAERVNVGVGRVSEDRIEILRGLKAGDAVILSSTKSYAQAQRLRLE